MSEMEVPVRKPERSEGADGKQTSRKPERSEGADGKQTSRTPERSEGTDGNSTGQGTPPRGVPLVATAGRLAAAMVALALGFVALDEAYWTMTHRAPSIPSIPVLATAFVVVALLCWSTLRAEEVRLARELRTARSGTPALRAMFATRRPAASLFARLFSSGLGSAAVLLADGSRSDALAAFARGSPLMRGGRLERLRSVVEADLDRAAGTHASVERCVERLRVIRRIGNREADLYRAHVRVKALLELGDAEGALDMAHELEASRDEEERVYLVWLRVWFDLDGDSSESSDDEVWRPLMEGELRMGTLLARAQGAEMLVKKLEARMAAIAQPGKGE
jgi:hypothetical protein